jgi:5-methylcytosine-specific restriction endonuclease McrA
MKYFIERHDPVVRANRVKNRKDVKHETLTVKSAADSKLKSEIQTTNLPIDDTHDADLRLSVARRITDGPRHELSSSLKHAVFLRDEGRCTYNDAAGIRCGQRRWLDIHHVVLDSRGGKDELGNLRTLCSAHHRMIHENRHG